MTSRVQSPYVPLTKHTSLTTCPVRTVQSLYYIPPPLTKHTSLYHMSHIQYNTDHMSSTYSPILYPTTHLRNTHHWPHVQYVQSYHYIRSHHPHTKRTALTYTCPVLCPITIVYPTNHLRNTHHWPHVQYYRYRSHHTTYETHIWPHVQYVQSYHYIRSHHPLTKHTSLTTCPVRTVLSLY